MRSGRTGQRRTVKNSECYRELLMGNTICWIVRGASRERVAPGQNPALIKSAIGYIEVGLTLIDCTGLFDLASNYTYFSRCMR